MRERGSRILPVLAAAGLLGSCASARPSRTEVKAPEALQSTARFRKEYVLAPDDQIEVVVQRMPEVSRALVIRPDGYISLPLLGDVQASGLTPRELDEKLTELFSARLVSPEVTVIALRVRQSVVYVAGEVGNPVAVPLRDAPTAMQAIAIAQGFRKSASGSKVTIIRLSSDGYLRAIPAGGGIGGQPGPYMALRMATLQPDDLIFVPESGRSQLGRFLDDFISRPLAGFNSVFATYVNFRLLQEINAEN